VALGHPIGDAVRHLDDVFAMRDTKRRWAFDLCLGGGNAVAMSVEAV
jgi:hypothetical protein